MKRIRIIAFVIRCVLIWLLPVISRFCLSWTYSIREEYIAMILWACIYAAYIGLEMVIRVKTQDAWKEPYWLFFVIFMAVQLPFYLYVLLPIIALFMSEHGKLLSVIYDSLIIWFVDAKLFTWPYLLFSLYELTVTIVFARKRHVGTR